MSIFLKFSQFSATVKRSDESEMNNISIEAGNKPEAGSMTDFQESSYRYVNEGHV